MVDDAEHVVIVGTCLAMCSVRELEDRQRFMEVNFHEAEPGTENASHPTGSPSLAVKRYARPAAGRELPLPSEIRPIAVLERATAHLIDLADSPFSGTYAFIADRLRAVVADMAVQAIQDERAARIYETIVRYHALAAVRHANEVSYSAYHNHELLSKALVSLMHIYANSLPADDARVLARAEFHAYHLLLHAADGVLGLSHARTLTDALHRSAPVALAMRLLHSTSAQDGLSALRLIGELPPTAVGCVLHLLPDAREAAAGALRRAYLKQELLPLAWACELLLLAPGAASLSSDLGPLGLALEQSWDDSAPASSASDSAQQPSGQSNSLAAVRIAPPTEPAPAGEAKVKGAAPPPLAVHSAQLQAWRSNGAKMASTVNAADGLWPAAAGGQLAAPLQPAVLPVAPSAPGELEPSADLELMEMLNMLRLQINLDPSFLRREPDPLPPAQVTAYPTSAAAAVREDDELAVALRDAIASLSGS
ncbi:SAC3/GANP/Nin1/mts3/eIF-3 p25 family-domain-containing protein [Pavlovales sp. CCMP2436]|nr:SAC3/GANP/Nin1/mts3/eIF-3 p25 family-domain-containing protein [Pavlovales sp. CCMP2436]